MNQPNFPPGNGYPHQQPQQPPPTQGWQPGPRQQYPQQPPPPHGWQPQPQWGGPRPPVKVPRNWGRTWLIGLLACVLVAAGAGAAGFSLARYFGDSGYGPVACEGSITCLRGVDANAVLADFEQRGFSCEKSDEAYYTSNHCKLAIGNNRYEVSMEARDDLIQRIEFDVSYHPDLDLSTRNLGYLVWLAVLPFEQDKAAHDVARKWLAEQLSGGTSTKVKIRGYEYELSRNRAGHVSLSVEGEYRS
ncbi:hypothetical protein [Flindersiella endophytica]